MYEWDQIRERTQRRTWISIPSGVVKPRARARIEETHNLRIIELVQVNEGISLPMQDQMVFENRAVIREWSMLDLVGISFDQNRLRFPTTTLGFQFEDLSLDEISQLALDICNGLGYIPTQEVLQTVMGYVLTAYVSLPYTFGITSIRKINGVPLPIAEIYNVSVDKLRAQRVMDWARRLEETIKTSQNPQDLIDATQQYVSLDTKPYEPPIHLSLVGFGRIQDAYGVPKEFIALEPIPKDSFERLKSDLSGFYRPGVITTLTRYETELTRSLGICLGPKVDVPITTEILEAIQKGSEVQTIQTILDQELEHDPRPAQTIELMQTQVHGFGWESLNTSPQIGNRRGMESYFTVVEGDDDWADSILSSLDVGIAAKLSYGIKTSVSKVPIASKPETISITILNSKIHPRSSVQKTPQVSRDGALVIVSPTSTVLIQADSMQRPSATRVSERQPMMVAVKAGYDAAIINVNVQRKEVDLVAQRSDRYLIPNGKVYYGGVLKNYVLFDKEGSSRMITSFSDLDLIELTAKLERVGKQIDEVVFFSSNTGLIAVGAGFWVLINLNQDESLEERTQVVSGLLCPHSWATMYQSYCVMSIVGNLVKSLTPLELYGKWNQYTQGDDLEARLDVYSFR